MELNFKDHLKHYFDVIIPSKALGLITCENDFLVIKTNFLVFLKNTFTIICRRKTKKNNNKNSWLQAVMLQIVSCFFTAAQNMGQN